MRKKPWLYSAPALLLILIVVVFPIGYTAYISLTNMNLYHWADFRVIGLSNYVRALFKFDSGFLGALFTTLLWTVVVCMMASSPSCQILMVTGSVAVSLPGAAALPLWGALEGVWPQPASIPSARAALNKREIAFFMVSPPFSM